MRRWARNFIGIAILIIPSFAQGKDLLWDEEMISNATVLLYQPVSKT
jgi:hypothetical protein